MNKNDLLLENTINKLIEDEYDDENFEPFSLNCYLVFTLSEDNLEKVRYILEDVKDNSYFVDYVEKLSNNQFEITVNYDVIASCEKDEIVTYNDLSYSVVDIINCFKANDIKYRLDKVYKEDYTTKFKKRAITASFKKAWQKALNNK